MTLTIKRTNEILDWSPFFEFCRICFVDFSVDENILVVDDVCRKLDTCARVLRFAVVHVGKLIQLANVADFVAVVDNARVVPPLGVISQVACCIVWNEFHWTS